VPLSLKQETIIWHPRKEKGQKTTTKKPKKTKKKKKTKRNNKPYF
jgi:hypothetical protein